MPKTIVIDGIIGWDVLSSDIQEQFKAANGEDIELQVNSPGGSVWDALGIFNTIRDYSANVRGVVNGIAASAAAYIVASVDELAVHDNSVFMIHNPWSIEVGDYRDFQKMADYLKGSTDNLARGFAKRTGMDQSEINKLMDDETWYFGENIVESGFADTVIETENEAKENEAVALGKMKLQACINTMQKDKEKLQEYQNCIHAYIDSQSQPKQQNDVQALTIVKKERKTMNLEELKKEHPDLYNQIFALGVNEERERTQAHLHQLKAGIAKDHAIEAIEKGTPFNSVEMSFYMTESNKKTDIEARNDDNVSDDTGADVPKDDISQEDQKKQLMQAVSKYSVKKMK